MRIDWPSGSIPSDEPQCGFLNELCTKDDGHVASMIVAGVLGLVLFCSIVITISIYRKWKVELEIEGLLWKIESHEIKGFFNNDIVSSPSKVCRLKSRKSSRPINPQTFILHQLSLVSAASYGSRCSNQVWTTTGRFRGAIVRIKELKFTRKKDMSRELMKEFRTLRDLRHDNINSFIGELIFFFFFLFVHSCLVSYFVGFKKKQTTIGEFLPDTLTSIDICSQARVKNWLLIFAFLTFVMSGGITSKSKRTNLKI